MSKVAIVKCESYTEEKINLAVSEAIELIGGLRNFAQPGEKVLLKPNLAAPYSPERAVTTHPSVVKSLTNLFLSAGNQVFIGDSPTGIHNPAYLKLVYKKTGMEEIANQTNAQLIYDTKAKEITFPQGKQMKHFTFFKSMLDTDVLVSVAKLKTHLYTKFTGATKNLYGTIPGVVKVAYHSKFQDANKFSQLLLDLYNYLKPKLSLIDGVIGMEGDGPAWGKPKKIGVILASADALSADWVACKIVGIDPLNVPMFRLNQIPPPEIVGASIEEVRIDNFLSPPPSTVEDGLIAIRWVPKFLRDKFGYHLLSKPVIIPEKCIACKICIEGCPQQTITLHENKAFILEKNCIRCWCCSENCPEGAVELKQSLLGKIFTHLV